MRLEGNDGPVNERGIRPVARVPLGRRVATALERYVVTRGLQAGDRLPPVRALAAHLQVSGPVLREALRALEAQGVLRTYHGKGTFVAAPERAVPHAPADILPDEASFAELRELRVALEVGLAGAICERATEADIAALEAILRPAAGEETRPVFNPRIDLAFHLRFVQIARNAAATHICERVLTPYFRANALLNPNMGWVGAEVFDARFRRGRHLAIVGALRTRDVDHLRQLVALHLDEERIAEERFAVLMAEADRSGLVPAP
jgi:GntR family transcriptional repressor for pyruvate dehydrogenase complex